MLEYTPLSTFSEYARKDKIFYSELDLRPVQVIKGHVIYINPYKY